MQNMVNVQTYKYISQKRNIWHISQVFLRVAFENIKGKNCLKKYNSVCYLTAICYRNIAAFHI